jgi:hypothetical protein
MHAAGSATPLKEALLGQQLQTSGTSSANHRMQQYTFGLQQESEQIAATAA